MSKPRASTTFDGPIRESRASQTSRATLAGASIAPADVHDAALLISTHSGADYAGGDGASVMDSPAKCTRVKRRSSWLGK
jgi:hypothetical protein